MQSRSSMRRLGLIIAATGLVGMQDGAVAQDAAARERSGSARGSGLEEVVVTATKMGETDVQTTALSITAFSADALRDAGVEGLQSLEGIAPGLSLSQNARNAMVYIRGIGSSNVFNGSDPSSTVYIDGVYIARPNMVLGDFVDLERVEVLRGPQGTLYGRNAVGGTINLVSRKPSDEVRARAGVEYGSFDRIRLHGDVSGPLVPGTLAGSFSGLYSERDGYVKNIAAGFDDLVDEDTGAVRGALLWTPNEALEVYFTADYSTLGGTGPMAKPRYVNADPAAGPPPLPPLFIDDIHTVNIDNPQHNDQEIWGGSATIVWDISERLQLTSITGYRGLHENWLIDVDFSEVDEWYQQFWTNQTQFTQEVQLSGSTERLQWVAGLYYLHEEPRFDLDFEPQFIWGAIPNLHVFINSELDTSAYALFGQGTYAVTDRLAATFGIRYSYEDKVFDTFGRALVPPGGPIIPIPGYPFARNGEDANWDAVTPKFGVDYRITDDVFVYASVTRGFKSGGFNLTGTEPPFEPEKIWAYEWGVKSMFLDGRMRLNAAGFYYDYTDLQVQAHTFEGTLDITNAASATIAGFEVEMMARPVPNLDVSASLAYLDTQYEEYVTARTTSPNVFVDLSGNNLNVSPEWTYNLSAQYSLPLADYGIASLRGDYSWQDRVYYSAFNDSAFSQESYGLLSGRLALQTHDERWTVAVYGRNLTDEDYFTGMYDFSLTGISGIIAEPRTLGVQVEFKY